MLSSSQSMHTQKQVRILFYDGACGLCTRSIRFLIKIDRKTRIRYAPLNGSTSDKKLPKELRDPSNLSTVVYLEEDSGRCSLHTRSNAVCAILKEVGGIWLIAGKFLYIIPHFLREGAYRLIAKYRYMLFPISTCKSLNQEEKELFLD